MQNLARLKSLARRVLIIAACVLAASVAAVIAALYGDLPSAVRVTLSVIAILSYTAGSVSACGWLFLASCEGFLRREMTLSDEFGTPTTYRGKGAIAWAIAGMALAVFMFLLVMTLPVGALLDWLGLS